MSETGAPDATSILIVDDMPENLEVLDGLLRAAGYCVKAANNGRSALRLAKDAEAPSLILLDVMMPGMDGYAVLDALRADPATRDIPVIFVTALAGAGDEEAGLARGAVDYIAKPLKPLVVLARVRTQLQARMARDVLRDQNTWLEQEVARRMTENDRIQAVSIRALAELAETRDQETGAHILRTQIYVRVLAEQLAMHPRFASTLTPAYIELLVRSAPLHDIGKVGIPDAILHKRGKLDDAEWTVMKTHALLGAQAIERAECESTGSGGDEPVGFLSLAKEIAHWHHEHWDGSGYPDALAGDAIPVSARLMALADVFDALSTCRVYKASFPADQVKREILAGRGTHFDPDVVDAFVACYDAFIDIAQRHADAH
ncbi:two-component system response regulator [Methyloversatilis sp. XJ19-13]|uniref:response regulator n=1 Tax=Methyloversatilis sp. XJ19-13 TaxID=2963430 RepID=UPI00211CFF3A|nr:two-component system response regulator [Methyloversatilis sp. XJ19-13]MCQ9374057.1 two-component system response regulator [Methyloversatilis sp. XJ19-13]